jgi:hypothetical protein
MRWLLAAAFGFAVARAALGAEAAPAAPPQTEDRSADATAKSEAAGRAEPGPKKNEGAPDVFVPSEDISEDLSVAFPIDI